MINTSVLLNRTRQELEIIFIQSKGELFRVLSLVHNKAPLNQLTVDDQTNELTGFRNRIQSRLIAGQTLGGETRDGVIYEVETMLIEVLEVLDYLPAIGENLLTQNDLNNASRVYGLRVDINTEFNSIAQGMVRHEVPFINNQGNVDQGTEGRAWIPLASLRGRSLEQMINTITKIVDNNYQINEDINLLFYDVISSISDLESVPKLIPEQDTDQYRAARFYQIADSQEFRNAIAGTFAPVLKKVVNQQFVPAYDEDWRRFYVATYNYLNKYLNQLLVEHPEWRKQEIKDQVSDNVMLSVTKDLDSSSTTKVGTQNDINEEIPVPAPPYGSEVRDQISEVGNDIKPLVTDDDLDSSRQSSNNTKEDNQDDLSPIKPLDLR